MKTLAALILLLVLPWHDHEEGWKLRKDQHNIQIFTRHVEGSGLKAIRATTVLNASLETCAAVLRDIPNLHELFAACLSATKVSQTANEQIHYLQMDAPWPVSDRDGVYRLTYSYDAPNETLTVYLFTVADLYPEQEGYLRLTEGEGSWVFTRLSEQQTRLAYFFHGEPGGNIPNWVANSVVVDNPMETLLNFHRLVRLERYQGWEFSFLE